MFKATVNVTLKKSVLDPQGKAVLHALDSLHFNEVKDVRVGKYFEVRFDAQNKAEAEARIQSMCDQLLINPVIEQYAFQVAEEK